MAEIRGFGKKGKGRKNISLDEKEKVSILNTVLKSDRPVAEVLRDLGVSRSTFYSWLKRYQGEGEEGLKDRRELEPRTSPEETGWKPAAGDTPPESRRPSPYADSAAPEPPMITHVQAVGATSTLSREESAVSSKTTTPSSPVNASSGNGNKGKTHSTFIILVGIIVIIAGLVLTMCMYNASGHYFELRDGKISLWKGKFAPFGKTPVEGFVPVDVGSLDVEPLLGTRYYGEWGAVNALVSHMLFLADLALEATEEPDYDTAGRLLTFAERVAMNGESADALTQKNAALKYRLVQKRVHQTERRLADLYQSSAIMLKQLRGAPLYGMDNVDETLRVLEIKGEELEKWLSDFSKSKTARFVPPVVAAPESKALAEPKDTAAADVKAPLESTEKAPAEPGPAAVASEKGKDPDSGLTAAVRGGNAKKDTEGASVAKGIPSPGRDDSPPSRN